MKMSRLIFGIIAVSSLLFISLHGKAQLAESKSLQKSFSVNKDTRIEVTNKYGKIELIPWGKDSVVVDIKIKVEDKKLSRLEKAMDNIDFDFTQSEHNLIITTVVGQNKSTLAKELLRFKENMSLGEANVEIDYKIWLPAGNELKVENKFGDIYCGDFSGDVIIDLSNGNLKAQHFSGNLELILNFSDASVGSMQDGSLDCTFSDVYIKKGGEVRVESKNTNFEFIEIESMTAHSRRDKFRLRSVDLLDVDGSFSNFRITQLQDRGLFRVSYGDIEVEEAAIDFSYLFVEARSTDVNLYFHEDANFNFEITAEKTDLDLGHRIQKTEEIVTDEKQEGKKISGSFGVASEEEKRLIINVVSGEVNILSY